MNLGAVIRRVWSRHDKRLLDDELMKESTGVELPGIVKKVAAMEAVGEHRGRNLAIRAVTAEAEAQRESEAAEDSSADGLQ